MAYGARRGTGPCRGGLADPSPPDLPRHRHPADPVRLRRDSGRTSRSSRFDETARSPALSDELDALRNISLVNGRAHYEFAVIEASLREAAARNERGYTRWVDDVLDSW